MTWGDTAADAVAGSGQAHGEHAARDAVAQALVGLGGSARALRAEAHALDAAFGPGGAPPTIDLYTRGEIGRLRGARGDRNHAVVVAALA